MFSRVLGLQTLGDFILALLSSFFPLLGFFCGKSKVERGKRMKEVFGCLLR